jgi:hypothetical protein
MHYITSGRCSGGSLVKSGVDTPLSISESQGGFVFGLVEADFGAAGEAEFCDGAPAGFLDGGKLDAFFGEGGDFGFQVVAHQVELVFWSVGRMDGDFGGWEGEDEPAVAGVDVMEAECVAEEGPVGVVVGAVEDEVSAGDHEALRSKAKDDADCSKWEEMMMIISSR